MKRQGNLLPAIASRDNLLLAFARARRGHASAPAARAFAADLERNVQALRAGLLRGDVVVGEFTRFEIRDPKPRVIHAPAFRERVLHHALMNLCEDRIDRYLIDDIYACRAGKGTHAAIDRAQRHARRFGFVLKLDIRRYFDSVDHEVLLRQLARLFKDRAVLALFARIVGSYATEPGRGLPIGTLTSQHFANLYLGKLDHHVVQDLRCRAYVRYMDDFLLFADTREELRAWRRHLEAWLASELHLHLKPGVLLAPTGRGFSFLGFRVLPTHLLLTGARKRRFRVALTGVIRASARGELSEAAAAVRLTSLCAHVQKARTHGLRRALLSCAAPPSERLAAGQPGRQLEQPGRELPLRESELQRAGQR